MIMYVLTLPTISAVGQTSRAILWFNPPALALQPGMQGTIKFQVQNVQEMYGLEFQITFDPEVIKVIDSDPNQEGVQVKPADWLQEGFVAVNHVDTDIGRIDFAATLLRPAQPASGSMVIASIPFATRKTGTSTLRIASAILSTRNAEKIPHAIQAGKIVVNASQRLPLAPADTLITTPAPGQLALAGSAILAFLVALVVFIFALRKR